MSWLNATAFYRSGKTPKFKVGQTVFKFKPRWLNKTIDKWVRECGEYKVQSISTKKSGFIFKEFTYVIKDSSTGEIINDVYESELSDKYLGIQYRNNVKWYEYEDL